MSKQKPQNLYSESFKRQVVKEVERGIFTVEQARLVYDLPTSSAIYRWLKDYGMNEKSGKVVYVMTKDEERENLILKRDNELLKKALEDAQVKILMLEAEIEVAEEKYGLNLKKKILSRLSTSSPADSNKAALKEESGEPVTVSASVDKPSTSKRKSLKRS